MTQYVTPEQLAKDIKGGQLPFEYDHSVYWPALMKLSDQRRAERLQRWEAGGKLIGESEDYLRGHLSHGVAAANTGSAESSTES